MQRQRFFPRPNRRSDHKFSWCYTSITWKTGRFFEAIGDGQTNARVVGTLGEDGGHVGFIEGAERVEDGVRLCGLIVRTADGAHDVTGEKVSKLVKADDTRLTVSCEAM